MFSTRAFYNQVAAIHSDYNIKSYICIRVEYTVRYGEAFEADKTHKVICLHEKQSKG